MFNVGQHVMAQWTNGQMYGARIVQFNGSMYEVVWDDGSPPLWLSPAQIQPDAGAGFPMGGEMQFAPGQPVMAQWTNGQMYGARILQGNGAMYEVAWDDGSPPLWLTPAQIQPAGGVGPMMGGAPYGAMGGQPYGAPQPVVPVGHGAFPGAEVVPVGHGAFPGAESHGMGTAVLARWTDGQMYGARIVQFNGSMYEVAWDDGSPNLWVTPADIVRR